MADISKIKLSDNEEYNLKDTQVRNLLSSNNESDGDISVIQLSDNTQYNIKDAQAREDIETITTDVKAQVNADKDLINNGVDFIDDETLNEYSDKIEEMQDAYKKFIPIQTTSGTEITLDNSNNDKAIINIGLEGNTEQEADPTPDNPQEVKVVTGDNTLDIMGLNLLDESKLRQGSGADSSSYVRCFIDSNYYLEPGTYTIISNIDTSIYKYAVGINTKKYPNTTGSVVLDTGWITSSYNSFTLTNPGYLGVGIAKLDGVSAVTPANLSSYYFMVYKGSYNSAITYEAYTSESYPINLGSLELCKIGDYQDYIYKENDKWYKHGAIGKVVLDGTENWQVIASVTPNTYGLDNYIIANRTDSTSPYLSNYFTSITTNQRYKDKTFFINIASRIAITYGNITSLANFKDWLSTHNTSVYYVLATATTTEITDTNLINQLEAIKLLSGTQNNLSIDADTLPTLNINYIAKANSHL